MKKQARATSNLRMIEMVARRLGNLNEEIMYVGGCATTLYITDESSLDVRATLDVDCVVDVISLPKYNKFEKQLREKGFKESKEDDVICRWKLDELIVDVMFPDKMILGFDEKWFEAALRFPVFYEIADGVIIKAATAPYFLAMKFAAFEMRGKNDFLASSDMEDIITVLDGRAEIVQEIEDSDSAVKQYLQDQCRALFFNEQFPRSLLGHLRDGTFGMERVRRFLDRLKKIIKIVEV